MQRFLWIMFMMSLITLLGCESQEQSDTKTAPHQVVKPEKAIKTEETQAKVPADQMAQAVADQAEKIAEEAAKAIEEEVIAIVEKQAEGSVDAVTRTMTKVVVVAQEAVVPDEIVIAASYGKVTLPHKTHAEAYECSTCHGDETPAAFDLGKEMAHKVCKGCHKDEGAGPTGCKGCHVK